jgi:sugar lactone lactonase YvrE
VPAGGGEPVVVAEGIDWPNGIGLSPDGATLYVADFHGARVLAFDREGGNRRVFAASPRGSCDGLAVDAEGGVWVALGPGAGIARFDAGGALIEIVEIPGAFVSSVSFAGTDLRDLLVTTADRVLRGTSPVAGLPVAPATL